MLNIQETMISVSLGDY